MLDPRTHHHSPTNSLQLYDETRHKTWESTNSNLWPSKPAQFRTQQPNNMDDYETSDIHYTRALSPTSRTQAIVKGQRELMEMVRNMPESNYELSLKDLVEHHHRVLHKEENTKEDKNVERKVREMPRVKSVKKRNDKKNINDRGGFYLNVAFPFSLGSKDKKKKNNNKKLKKNESTVNCSSKVTPKPSVSDGSVKEWWKKSPSAFKDNDSTCASSVNTGSIKSSGSSSSSNSSGSRRSSSRREKHGGRWCLSFMHRLKIHTKK